jgi:hypothetical protein
MEPVNGMTMPTLMGSAARADSVPNSIKPPSASMAADLVNQTIDGNRIYSPSPLGHAFIMSHALSICEISRIVSASQQRWRREWEVAIKENGIHAD